MLNLNSLRMGAVGAAGLWLIAVGAGLPARGASGPDVALVAPLFGGLGNLKHSITTPSAKAQRYFNQGLTLCYAFNHVEAIRSFRGALVEDPNCAMACWGIAYASGPHVNRPMTAEDNTRAWIALQQAIALKGQASPKEQAYIDALARRYQESFAEDRLALDKAYAAAMRDVARAYPDDLDAQTLLAEALMDTMPWDYWAKDRSPKPETEEALAALRVVIARDPNHPGANHLMIHAVEAGPTPELGLEPANRLLTYAPQAGHLVHMPSHIYVRVGEYEQAARANVLASRADESYIRHCRAQGFYPGVYYPHNVHFLWYARFFQGRRADAMAAAEKVAEYALDNYCGNTKAMEGPRLRHLPWLTAARFGQWDEVLKVPRPSETNDFLVDRAMWHFVRGLAFAARHQATEAAAEHAAMQQLVQSDQARSLDNPQFPATGMLAVADHWLAGRVAGAQGQPVLMVAELEKAVAAEDALPYMEPAFWPIPTRPALGAALLRTREPGKAEAVFREDLKRWPRNGWALFGLEQSLRAQDKVQAANAVRAEFETAWKQADGPISLTWY